MALDAHLLLSHYLHKDLCQLTWPCHSNFKHQRWLHMAGYKPDWEPPSGCSTARDSSHKCYYYKSLCSDSLHFSLGDIADYPCVMTCVSQRSYHLDLLAGRRNLSRAC